MISNFLVYMSPRKLMARNKRHYTAPLNAAEFVYYFSHMRKTDFYTF